MIDCLHACAILTLVVHGCVLQHAVQETAEPLVVVMDDEPILLDDQA